MSNINKIKIVHRDFYIRFINNVKTKKNVGWDYFRNLDENWLKTKVEDDCWDEVFLKKENWDDFVNEEEQIYIMKVKAEFSNPSYMLTDGKPDAEFFIPYNYDTAWQSYRNQLENSYKFQRASIDLIEESCIKTLRRLKQKTEHDDPTIGLVVGNVQSGKTANMAGLMAMAADFGWNFFIVLSGTIENLREQTQERLSKDLFTNNSNCNWQMLPHLTKNSKNCISIDKLNLNERNNNKYMTVCLKVSSRLESLLDWLQDDPKTLANLRILVIDDEADQAGINTADIEDENEKKKINKLLNNLAYCRNKEACSDEQNTFDGHYKSMSYILYTATPYANCLNEIGNLYPKNFIHTLTPSLDYIGPSQIFNATSDDSQNDNLDIIRTISLDDYKQLKSVCNSTSCKIPNSLQDALLWFFCVAAIMRKYDYKSPISMLIHTSSKQKDHEIIEQFLIDWIGNNKKLIPSLCRKIYETETKRFTKEAFRKSLPDYPHPDNEIFDYVDFDVLVPYIEELIENVDRIKLKDQGELKYSKHLHLCVDNCSRNRIQDEEHIRLAYPSEKKQKELGFSTAFIVIGGNTLSRGLTLKGLVSSYFLRTVKQADTLMQMARWFGYKIHYELFQRIWITDTTKILFRKLTEMDQDLRDQISFLQNEKDSSPLRYPLAITSFPGKGFLITAKNKSQGAMVIDYDYFGTSMQTYQFPNNYELLEQNIETLDNFIHSLPSGHVSEIGIGYVWDNIRFEDIYNNMLSNNKFNYFKGSNLDSSIGNIKTWVNEQTQNGSLSNWSVIVSGLKNNSSIWTLDNGYSVGKVNRSRMVSSNDAIIDIGALSNPSDFIKDLRRIDFKDDDEWNSAITEKSLAKKYGKIRQQANKNDVPLLVIYRVDKDSKTNGHTDRVDLNAPCDLIGFALVLPKISRGNHKLRMRLTPSIIDEEVCETEDLGATDSEN